MTNREKYAEEILDISCNSVWAVNKENNRPVMCEDISCVDCAFNMCGCSCSKARSMWLKQKYTEPFVDWSKVEVDTPILVRNHECHKWEHRHFAKYDGCVYAWVHGRTSYTEASACSWAYAKLAESEVNDHR